MKRILSVFLCACLITTLFPLRIHGGNAETQTIEEAGFQCGILPDGTLEILRYTGNAEELAIPGQIGGKAVSRIGEEAFFGMDFNCIFFPAGAAITIGESAFEECSALEQLDLGDAVREIGDYAFSSCTSLTGITVQEGLQSIGNGAFAGCTALPGIVLPASLRTIGNYAFARCTALAEAVLLNRETAIGKEAFPDHVTPAFREPDPEEKDNETDSGTDNSGELSFLSLGELWGLSFQEIAERYPNHIVNQKATIYNLELCRPTDFPIKAERYLPLGWTDTGAIMVLCESSEWDGTENKLWPEPSIGYINAYWYNGQHGPSQQPDSYADWIPDRAAGLPDQFWNVNAVAKKEITYTRYSHGYNFNITIKEGENLTYRTTVETPEGKFDYVHTGVRDLGDRAGLSCDVMIPHGLIQIAIPMADCEVRLLSDRYAYTGEIVYPEAEVTYRGYVLKEGEDYQIVSDSVEPGNANARISGMGYFSGTTSVDYMICHTSVELLPVEDIVLEETVPLRAVIRTTDDEEAYAGVPSEDNITWELKGVYQTAEWTGQDTVKQDNEYQVCRSLIPDHPGEYEVSVEYNGVRASRKFIVEPKLTYSAGPLLEDGTLAEGKNRDRISSYTDIRVETDYDEANLSFLRKFLEDRIDDTPLISENNLKSVKQYVVADQEHGKIYLLTRVRPILAENETNPELYKGKFELSTPAEQHLKENLTVTNGLLTSVCYRAELTKSDEEKTKGQNLTSKQASHLFYFDDQNFYHSSYRFDNSLAVMSLGLEMASFSAPASDRDYTTVLPQETRAANLISAFDDLDFRNVELYDYDRALTFADDRVAYGIGFRYISSRNTDDTLIAVVIRGGGYGAEWSSNFHVGASGNHLGFSLPANSVCMQLNQYIGKLNEEKKIIGKLKIWVMGFSRGGAVANLVGEKLASGVIDGEIHCEQNDMFIYTFATPAGHRGSNSTDCSNIFNFISPNDLVPHVAPASWGFRRNGVDVSFPVKTPKAVEDAYYAYRGEKLNLSNLEWLSNGLIETLTTFYPDSARYTKMAEYCIRFMEQYEMQEAGGSFISGFAWGLIFGMLGDLGEAMSTQSFTDNVKTFSLLVWDLYQIITGKALVAEMSGEVLEDVAGGTILEKLNEIGLDKIKDSVLDADALGVITSRIKSGLTGFMKSVGKDITAEMFDGEKQGIPKLSLKHAHYPEHYLAWLETGGEYPITGADSFALKTNLERENIAFRIAWWLP